MPSIVFPSLPAVMLPGFAWIVVADLGNRPDGRFKRTDRQRQHVGLLFFQIGAAAAASHLLERAAVQLIQLFSNCLIQFPQRKEFAVA